ncbi:hypothetical protein [Mycobacterium sp. 4858]|uniref:hypothetical protein n=1 Tax=Mycobacterium sp. 4858 TaxID=2057185 RepID=UPI001E50F5DD|nr:hypothetical protein [Mycobacterium sp. 4858]
MAAALGPFAAVGAVAVGFTADDEQPAIVNTATQSNIGAVCRIVRIFATRSRLTVITSVDCPDQSSASSGPTSMRPTDCGAGGSGNSFELRPIPAHSRLGNQLPCRAELLYA